MSRSRNSRPITVEAWQHLHFRQARAVSLTVYRVLREGAKADIALFDPTLVRDRSTFEQPHQYAEGVDLVIINGQVVLDSGSITSARAGRVLYGPAVKRP